MTGLATARTKRSPLRKGPAGGSALLRVGFIPLVDSASLIVAQEKGFAAAEGLVLDLQRDTSWANIRDRLTLGHFDAAHMLGPMPLAANLGAGQFSEELLVPMSLNLGGNAITLSTELVGHLAGAAAGLDPVTVGQALAAHLEKRTSKGHRPLTMAIVYPFSAHNYELRYWLASSGIHPDRDVRLIVVPPPLMVDALARGHVDGFCVGAPWNDLAAAAGVGRPVVTKSQLWRHGPEKVLALRRDQAEARPEQTDALVRAVVSAAQWADDPANRDELVAILAQPGYVGAPAQSIARVLAGRVLLADHGDELHEPDYIVFARHAATFPWRSHALWFYSQMVRWGQMPSDAAQASIAQMTYRPDIYRRAVRPLGLSIPGASSKVEGALEHPTPVGCPTGYLTLGPDGFFDGRRFDPDALDAYLDGFEIHSRTAVPDSAQGYPQAHAR